MYIARNEVGLRTVQGFSSAKLTRFVNMLRDNREHWSPGSYYTNYPNNWDFRHSKLKVRLDCHAHIYDVNTNRLLTQLTVFFKPFVLQLNAEDKVVSIEGWVYAQGKRLNLNETLRGFMVKFHPAFHTGMEPYWYGTAHNWGMIGEQGIVLPTYHPGVVKGQYPRGRP